MLYRGCCRCKKKQRERERAGPEQGGASHVRTVWCFPDVTLRREGGSRKNRHHRACLQGQGGGRKGAKKSDIIRLVCKARAEGGRVPKKSDIIRLVFNARAEGGRKP